MGHGIANAVPLRDLQVVPCRLRASRRHAATVCRTLPPRTGCGGHRSECARRVSRLRLVAERSLSAPMFAALRLLREPVPHEKQRLMRERWASLDLRWRAASQGLGQQATGCGATIGIHPRCDFACTGCYLGGAASVISLVIVIGMQSRTLVAAGHLCSCVAIARSAASRIPGGIVSV